MNAIAETYVSQTWRRELKPTARPDDFLQKRIAELQQQIRTAEERLVNYAKNNQIISLDPNQNTVVERLAVSTNNCSSGNERKTAEAAYNAAKAPGCGRARGRRCETTWRSRGEADRLRQKARYCWLMRLKKRRK